MRKFSIISLCILAIIAVIEARPWCGIYGCSGDSEGGYDDNGDSGSDEGGNSDVGYGDGGYGEGYHSDDRYREDDGYRADNGYRDYGGNRGYSRNRGYGGNRGYDGYRGYDRNAYSLLQQYYTPYNNRDRNRGGYRTNSGCGGSGRCGSGGGCNEGGGCGVSGGGGGKPDYHNRDDRGNDANYKFLPNYCEDCTIQTYGNGERNTNTFNLPRDPYD